MFDAMLIVLTVAFWISFMAWWSWLGPVVLTSPKFGWTDRLLYLGLSPVIGFLSVANLWAAVHGKFWPGG